MSEEVAGEKVNTRGNGISRRIRKYWDAVHSRTARLDNSALFEDRITESNAREGETNGVQDRKRRILIGVRI